METEILDCGHERIPAGISPGYAILPDNRRICLNCADDMEVEELKTADRYFAYLSSDNQTVTTWSGRKLGSVTHYHYSRPAKRCYVRVTDVHGVRWYGSGPLETGTYVRLHRVKGR